MGTNVPKPVMGDNGWTIPAESDILTGVLADFQAAFGGDLNPALETPQGQLASSLAAIIGNAYATFLYYTQQVDPSYSRGRMQDGIGRIYFLERIPAQQTLVQATCTGAVGVVIPVGSQAQAADGNLYVSTEDATIPDGGNVVIPFICTIFGPIACPENTLNKIYQAIPGWDTINNLADGVLGSDTESRSQYENRRRLSVANNSRGFVQAIRGTLLALPGVLDAYVIDNPSGAPVTIGDFTLAPHSLFAAVVGGDDLVVATAIWSKKAPGCDYNGNTTVIVTDSQSGYNPPLPTYQVTFERPATLPVLFEISIVNTPAVPANAAALVQQAIINAFAGGDGGARATIGSTIFASRFFAPIIALGAWAMEIVNLLIGSSNSPAANFQASISGTTLTVPTVNSGALGAGQVVDDNTGLVIEGTTILHQLTGPPGQAGTYQLDTAQTVGSENMTSTLANQTTVNVNIDQVPVTDANLIVVNFV